MQRKSIFKALVGSHNYNLNNERSDKDYKLFVMPTFEDLYKGNFYSSANISDAMDIDIHDVRKIPNLFWKANINFLEVLFSKEIKVEPEFIPFYKTLYNLREEIAAANLPYLFNACIGMSIQKVKRMDKYSESMEYSKEFGYNVKEAAHAFRLLNFLRRYTEYENFAESIWYRDTDLHREIIVNIRRGVYNRDAIEQILENEHKIAMKAEKWYKDQTPHKYINTFLEGFVMMLVKNEFIKGEKP